MTRYFFDLHTEYAVDQDTEGLEFPSLQTAVADALQARLEIMQDEEICGERAQRLCRFEIRDQSGQVVATVPDADQ